MKSYRSRTGPVSEAVYYNYSEIETTCADELRAAGLYPATPEPIRIDRFIEKRFSVSVEYGETEKGVLGYTVFGSKGVEAVVVSRSLAEEGSATSERRVSSTMAHEAGHGLFHAHLFAFERDRLTSLFGSEVDSKRPRILCRDPKPQGSQGYDGRWWELHANQAIGALLLPRTLALQAIEHLTSPTGNLGLISLAPTKREQAVRHLAETFGVNPVVARIRLDDLFGQVTGQLTL